jgi:hypothetical protein
MRRNDPRATALILMVLAALWVARGCMDRRPPGPGPRSTGPGPAVRGVSRPSTSFTTGDWEGCPPEGDGGDPALNRLKNRDVPPPSYDPMTVEAILDNHPAAAEAIGRKDRDRWTAAALSQVKEWEQQGVAVEGYLLKIKQEGPESCNCHVQEHRDYHVWLSASPDDDRSRSMVVEVSPRVQQSHENWRLRILSRLAKDRARVRISGWLMWDQEHPEQIGQTRGTLWEIHPIHMIEVYSGGRWREL